MTVLEDSSPFRPRPPPDVKPGPRWRRAVAATRRYLVAGGFRLAIVLAAVTVLVAVPYRPATLRIVLAIVSSGFLAADVAATLACVRLARLPRGLAGGGIPAFAALFSIVEAGFDIAALATLREFVPDRAPAVLSALADRWSALHLASALLAGAQPFVLLVFTSRIAHRIGDTVLAQRARVFALYIPIAIVTLLWMRSEGYGAPSILVPAALPLGGPFGILAFALFGTYLGLLVRLRGAMLAADPVRIAEIAT